MKTIIDNESKVSKYIFEDSDTVTFEGDQIHCEHFIIGDMNSGNATLLEGVTPPDDWAGCRYIFDSGTWTQDSNWTDPKEAEIAELEARLAELKS